MLVVARVGKNFANWLSTEKRKNRCKYKDLEALVELMEANDPLNASGKQRRNI